jgi:precorrin-4 C11-methyltransferase
MISIIVHSEKSLLLAQKLVKKGLKADITHSPNDLETRFQSNEALVFIGSLGICVREIAPFLKSKKKDPAVVNIDANGQFVQSVISGHLGGANDLANEISRLLGATPIITTVSDTSSLWSLDLLPERLNWKIECAGKLTKCMADFVNGNKTALLLETRDKGTLYMESSVPVNVDCFTHIDQLKPDNYELIIAVSPFLHDFGVNTIFYRPPVIHLGVGSQKGIHAEIFEKELDAVLQENKISRLSVCSLSTVSLKKDEQAFIKLVPNPSEKVNQVTGTYSVCEASAMHGSGNSLLAGKIKRKAGEHFFTTAIAYNRTNERKGYVEFVGAGPGDPELVSVRGKRLLQTADYILYAGSLVPKELTHYAKPGCVVESSASMDLETQLASMKAYYNRGLFVVRLHTGDPCIYGAIQEQMAIMDEWGWNYSITPGISSFQAAAAALRSQFTIPEEVQTIILTRGEGRTPMPEREQLHKLAQSQSTMCIYLSASIAPKIQDELLVHYSPDTPVAICYKLTWKDERIFRCSLNELAQTVEENKLSMTTLIVVGKAIDNRQGVSKLYNHIFNHAFRKGENK